MAQRDTGPAAPEEIAAVLRERARLLYDGKAVPHRSCGICIAETFGRDFRPYEVLRRGGVTGEGTCGAIMGGQLVLGELLGSGAPSGPIEPRLKRAAVDYQAEVKAKLPHGADGGQTCNSLTGRFASFDSEERHASCTAIAAAVAEIVAKVLAKEGALEAPLALVIPEKP